MSLKDKYIKISSKNFINLYYKNVPSLNLRKNKLTFNFFENFNNLFKKNFIISCKLNTNIIV